MATEAEPSLPCMSGILIADLVALESFREQYRYWSAIWRQLQLLENSYDDENATKTVR